MENSFLSFLNTPQGGYVASFICGYAVAQNPDVAELVEVLGYHLQDLPGRNGVDRGQFLLGMLARDKCLFDALRACYSLPESGAAVSLEPQCPVVTDQEVECSGGPAELIDSGEVDDEHDASKAGSGADHCWCDPAHPSLLSLSVNIGNDVGITVSAAGPVSMTVDGHAIQIARSDASCSTSDDPEANGDDESAFA